jgi:peptidoglycan/xylan/chitin deacetylase (PgdA/CDA1 family)
VYDTLFDLIAASLGPVPTIGSWPRGKSWALVLTHDVEHRGGYESIERLCALERRRGFRSAWYLVPERDYAVDDVVVRALENDGFEVGVHGLKHDGRDLDPAVLPHRLSSIQAWRDRWGSVGFRSPATHRDWNLMPTLGFVYDSSSFDTDPFEPQSGGCCTWLPFHNGELVELPLTVTMDHTLFVVLRGTADVWTSKVDYLRSRGGMAVVLTHPDYMEEAERLEAYDRLLARYEGAGDLWAALPRDVARWWNRRAATSIEVAADGSLTLAGPAADEAEIVVRGAGSADAGRTDAAATLRSDGR